MRRFSPFLLVGLFVILQACSPEAADTPPPCRRIGQTWESPIDGAVLVCVPAGEFIMGGSEDDPHAEDREMPQHVVTLDAYWIDQTEVTNAQYNQCIEEGGCIRQGTSGLFSKTRDIYAEDEQYANYPALMFYYDKAVEFCQWAGRRIPTEAEWEKAARGTDGQMYPWGDDAPTCEHANYLGCAEDTTEVGGYPLGASPYGAVDMSGNVWEWVSDFYDEGYYANSPEENPGGPTDAMWRGRRGGGVTSFERDMRSSRRASGSPHHWFDGQMGFRCAVDGQ